MRAFDLDRPGFGLAGLELGAERLPLQIERLVGPGNGDAPAVAVEPVVLDHGHGHRESAAQIFPDGNADDALGRPARGPGAPEPFSVLKDLDEDRAFFIARAPQHLEGLSDFDGLRPDGAVERDLDREERPARIEDDERELFLDRRPGFVGGPELGPVGARVQGEGEGAFLAVLDARRKFLLGNGRPLRPFLPIRRPGEARSRLSGPGGRLADRRFSDQVGRDRMIRALEGRRSRRCLGPRSSCRSAWSS